MSFTYNSQTGKWEGTDVKDLTHTTANNFLEYGQPYSPYDKGFLPDLETVGNPTVVFSQNSAMATFGKSIGINNFSFARSFIAGKINVPDGTYSFKDLVDLGIAKGPNRTYATDLYVSMSPPAGMTRAQAAYVFGSIGFALQETTTFSANNGIYSIDAKIGMLNEDFDFESKNIPPEIEAIVSTLVGPENQNFDRLVIEYTGVGKLDFATSNPLQLRPTISPLDQPTVEPQQFAPAASAQPRPVDPDWAARPIPIVPSKPAMAPGDPNAPGNPDRPTNPNAPGSSSGGDRGGSEFGGTNGQPARPGQPSGGQPPSGQPAASGANPHAPSNPGPGSAPSSHKPTPTTVGGLPSTVATPPGRPSEIETQSGTWRVDPTGNWLVRQEEDPEVVSQPEPAAYISPDKLGIAPSKAPSTLGQIGAAIGGVVGAVMGVIGGLLGAIGQALGSVFGGGGSGGRSSSRSSSSGGSRGSSSMGGYGDGSSGRAGWAGKPILLDLSGKGLSIDTLGSSQQFIDLDGSGYQHRTAWAGDGTGVLVLDADGDGKISRSSEFIFTEWDPTAQTDLEAIKNIFDTNHNGMLDAGDLRWADFKVMINGQLASLDSLGITSIGLTPKGSGQNFEDGSSITGTAEYTKSDGSTGTVGDAVLAVDPNGYVIKTVTTANADGSKTVDLTGYNKDGTVAFRNRTLTSSDGQSRTTQFDDDGNGTWDRSQTDITTVVAGGRQRIVSNFKADGSLSDRITTLTSLDGKTVTTSLDQDGDGQTDQTQIYLVGADGSTSTTISQFAVDGTLQKKVSVTSSSDGLSKTTKTDSDGDGLYDQIINEATVVGGDGSRTKTVERRGNDGALISRETTLTAADGRAKTVSHDLDGSGAFETRDESTISVDASGVVTTTTATYSGTNSLIGKTIATQSANGLAKTIQTDVDGDGTFDLLTSDTTIVAADGTRTQTEQAKSTDGALLGQTVTTISADRKSLSIVSDSNGDGKTDTTKTILVDANGVTTTTQTALNADGSVNGSTWDQSSADGRSVTTKADLDGDGIYDVVATDVTTSDGSNSQIRAVNVSSANGTLLGGKVLTTSSDSLTQTLREDLDGNGTADLVTTKAIVLASDGSRTETTSSYSANGALLDRTTIVVSADRKTSVTSIDADGDGHIDRTVTEIEAANGSVTTTVVDTSADGVQHAKSETTKSGNGLITTENLDVNGDGVYDSTTRSVTTIGADASRTTTVEKTAANGSLIAKTTSSISGNGLSITTQTDVDGDGSFDLKSTDTTALNSDGSRTRTASDFAGTSLIRNSTVTTAANGLSSTIQVDFDGNGTADQTTLVSISLGANGSRTETTTVRAGDNGLLSKSTTTVNADKTLSVVSTDANGDGQNDYVKTTSIAADGTTTVTEKTFNANGSLDAKAETAVSANGLKKTKRSDINGDGIFDLVETDATVLNADGSKTRTFATTSSNGSLISKSIATTSGNGLTTTILTDSTGDGVVDWKVADQLTLAADGSKTQTITTRSGNDNLLSQKIIVESGNGRTITTTIDADGDGAIDTTETITLLDNGNVDKVIRLTAADGSTISSTKASVSADGLIKSVRSDGDGDGTFDNSVSETTVLNADGSRKTTKQWRTGNGTLVASTETSISRSGLAINTSTDFNGDGIVDESSSDATILNANGSKTRTVSHFDGANGLRDKTITITSANGYSVTTASDLDGNGAIDRTSTTVRALAEDGGVTDTTSVVNGAGNLISKTTAKTSTDRKKVTTQYDLDGDGYDDLVKVAAKQANGSTIETIAAYSGTGATWGQNSLSIKTTSSDGLTETIETDTNGDEVADRSSLSSTVLNADGSKTQTFTNSGPGGVLKDKTIVTTSANGLVISTQWMANGTSTTRSLDDVTTLNADGSTARTLTYKKAGGALESKTITTTSGDKKTITKTIDVDGNGVSDKKSTRVVNADGSVTTTYLDLGTDGTLVVGRKTVTESANGLSVTTEYDANGDGTVDSRIVEATILNADGSKTTTITRYSGTTVAVERTIIVLSADGKTQTTSYDLNADGTIDKKQTSSTAFGPRSGYSDAKTESIENAVGTTVKSRFQTSTSANGMSTTKEWDVDGNGTVDQSATETLSITNQGTIRTVSAFNGGTKTSSATTTTSNNGRTVTTVEEFSQSGMLIAGRPDFSNRTTTIKTETLADGATVERKVFTNTSNGVVQKELTRTSADGREITIERDIDGNGTIDQIEQRTKLVDGTTKTVVTGYSSPDKTTITTSFDGLSSSIEWDMDLHGAVDRRRLITTSKNADGSQSSTSTDYKMVAGSADKRVKITSSSVSADARTKSLSIDTNGDGVFDKVTLTLIDASGGSVTTTTNYAEAQKAENIVLGEIYWKQAIAAKVVTTVASDGLTVTEQSDYDGNGTFETTAVSRTQIDGSVRTDYTEVGADGSAVATGTMLTSSDGRTKIFIKINKNRTIDRWEKTETFIDGQIVRTVEEYNPNFSIKKKTAESILANGNLSHRYVWDGAGVKTEEYIRQTNGTALQYTYVGTDAVVRSVHLISKDGKLVSGTFYDPKSTDPWNSIEQTYNADGKKTLEKQFMDDGTRVDISFDVTTEKQTQALSYDTSNRLIAQATYSNGILAGNVLFDPTNAKPWTRVEQTYTGDGTKVAIEKQFMDNGTSVVFTFDVANTQIWTTFTSWRNTAGQEVEFDWKNRDGTRDHEFRDTANLQTWRVIAQRFNAAEQQVYQYQYNDDGTYSYTRLDEDSSRNWKNYTEFYDAAGRLVEYDVKYDDGTRYHDWRDPANTATWSLIYEQYNASGALYYQVRTEDDGSSTSISYDPTNAQNWSSYSAYYDTAGRRVGTNIIYDDGSRYRDWYDPTNAESWSTIIYNYNAAGTLKVVTVTYDNNTSYRTDYDFVISYNGTVLGQYKSYTSYKNSAGVETKQEATNYDGSGWATWWGSSNGQSYYSYSENYDTQNRRTKAQVQNNSAGNNFDDIYYDYDNSQTWTTYTEYWRSGTKTWTYVYDDGRVVNGPTAGGGGGGHRPVVLDLDKNGSLDIRTLTAQSDLSGPRFDWDGDGLRDQTSWAGPSDGFLTIDLAADGSAGPDGIIDQAKELAFNRWLQGSGEPSSNVSDLEALALVFDTNKDGVLDVNDARWNEFRIWRDANQNGVTDAGELMTLSDAGVTRIGLTPNPSGATSFDDGSAITGTSWYETVGGTRNLVGDVTLVSRQVTSQAAPAPLPANDTGNSVAPANTRVDGLVAAMATFGADTSAGTTELNRDGSEGIGTWKQDPLAASSRVWAA
ncbi:hypothetical protein [Mesorhizobium sp. NPDC059025]|uniref:hypothetical protein n=1 Tax=unclassified Mesorhizobium TaxID=325217 RepID=UPI0036CFA0F9